MFHGGRNIFDSGNFWVAELLNVQIAQGSPEHHIYKHKKSIGVKKQSPKRSSGVPEGMTRYEDMFPLYRVVLFGEAEEITVRYRHFYCN